MIFTNKATSGNFHWGGNTLIDGRVELEEQIRQQEHVIRHLDNQVEKYMQNNEAIKELLRKYDCNELNAVLLVSWLRICVV